MEAATTTKSTTKATMAALRYGNRGNAAISVLLFEKGMEEEDGEKKGKLSKKGKRAGLSECGEAYPRPNLSQLRQQNLKVQPQSQGASPSRTSTFIPPK